MSSSSGKRSVATSHHDVLGLFVFKTWAKATFFASEIIVSFCSFQASHINTFVNSIYGAHMHHAAIVLAHIASN